MWIFIYNVHICSFNLLAGELWRTCLPSFSIHLSKFLVQSVSDWDTIKIIAISCQEMWPNFRDSSTFVRDCQCTCLHTPFILHFFWGNKVPNDWKLLSNPFEALGESADENMVKEISVLDCNVRSKAPDRKQIEEENIFFGYLKNESCFPAIIEGSRGRFWVSKQRRCFS